MATADDLEIIRTLFREYADGLDIDLASQGFEAELARLPGKYAGPAGGLLIARNGGGQPLGCVGMRPLDLAETCEIKRLYVRPAGRGTGLGRALAIGAIEFASRSGYARVVLDTLPGMSSAIGIYRSLGFEPIPAYWPNPIADSLYLEKRLTRPES